MNRSIFLTLLLSLSLLATPALASPAAEANTPALADATTSSEAPEGVSSEIAKAAFCSTQSADGIDAKQSSPGSCAHVRACLGDPTWECPGYTCLYGTDANGCFIDCPSTGQVYCPEHACY